MRLMRMPTQCGRVGRLTAACPLGGPSAARGKPQALNAAKQQRPGQQRQLWHVAAATV